jgi:hypothetical protein
MIADQAALIRQGPVVSNFCNLLWTLETERWEYLMPLQFAAVQNSDYELYR